MPILLVFALTAACLPLDWPAPLVGGGVKAAGWLTAAAVCLSLTFAIVLRTWVLRTLRHWPSRKVEVAQTYGSLRRVMFFTNVGLVTVCVVVFGWGWLTQQVFRIDWRGESRLAPFAELTVPLPYFAILFGAWVIYFDAERMLHRTTILGPTTREFWGRIDYFFHHLRQFALLVMLPVMLFVTQQTISRYLPETARSDWFKLLSVAMIPLLILMMPLLIKPLLGLKTLPAGPVRDRLEALAKRLHFRCTDFLLWPTHGAMANAMIVGLVPRVRYVIFTDRIIEELPPDELDAVFGHEVGHAKHGHVWLYAGFLAVSITTLAAFLLFVEKQLPLVGIRLTSEDQGWIALPPVVLVAVYVFLVFGYLSRRCERQADVYGCRAISCVDPSCLGHESTTQYPEQARGLCATGIRTFVRALERVELINGSMGLEEDHHPRTLRTAVRGFFKWIKAWQHSTMPRRIAFLRGLIGHFQKERQFQTRMHFLRWGLILGLLGVLYALGEAVGWHDLMEM